MTAREKSGGEGWRRAVLPNTADGSLGRREERDGGTVCEERREVDRKKWGVAKVGGTEREIL